ncbi:MAG: sugar phosphate isomerase/epimerase family protein [Candidatus Bipolaricaulia bacterium]
MDRVHMKLGIGALVSIVGDDQTIWHRRCELAERAAPEFVEVWIEHWRGNRWLLEQHGEELRALLRAFQVLVHAPFLWTSLIAPEEPMRRRTLDEMKATLDLCALLRAEVMTVHGGVTYADDLRRETCARDILQENLQELAAYGQRAGVVVAVENLQGERGILSSVCYPRTTDDLVRLVERVPHARGTLDIGHTLQNDEPPLAALRRALPILANIHLHDMSSDGQAHRALGEGVLDLDAVVDVLVAGQYSGYVTVEVSDRSESKERILESYRRLTAAVAARGRRCR